MGKGSGEPPSRVKPIKPMIPNPRHASEISEIPTLPSTRQQRYCTQPPRFRLSPSGVSSQAPPPLTWVIKTQLIIVDCFCVCVFFCFFLWFCLCVFVFWGGSVDGRISLGGHVVFEDNTFAISPEMETELFDLFKARKETGKRERACNNSSSSSSTQSAVKYTMSSEDCCRNTLVRWPSLSACVGRWPCINEPQIKFAMPNIKLTMRYRGKLKKRARPFHRG